MPPAQRPPFPLSRAEARRCWLHAQRLDTGDPFGDGPNATRAAIEHLGYVQIDTIHVVERAHHHILWSRIPGYRRADLHHALSLTKSIFEYWTHALAYIPTRDYRFFVPAMHRQRTDPTTWFGDVSPADVRRIVARVRREGALSIRDIDDDELVEKHHPWASRKPSKRALQRAFLSGAVTVSERAGMLKTYDLTDRHFGWTRRPRAPRESRVLDYLLDRALASQGIVSLDSICYLDAPRKAAMADLIAARVRRRRLVPVAVEDAGVTGHWMRAGIRAPHDDATAPVHILSPFDPLIIQRKRLAFFFGYDHRFEAYVPKARRKLGYFALPVLVDDRIAAAIDIKTDRRDRKLLIRQWTWAGGAPAAGDKARIEDALHRFEAFQLSD